MKPFDHLRCMRTLSQLLLILALLTSAGCSKDKGSATTSPNRRLSVVTTLFPSYDFARYIAGDRGEVSLLLPPGAESHGFEPKPEDIVRIRRAHLFIYTSPLMEPWAVNLIKGFEAGHPKLVEAGAGIAMAPLPDTTPAEHGGGTPHSHDTHGRDPHIWLDFGNAARMVDNIRVGFTAADPANEAYFRQRADALKGMLGDLDRRYRTGLSHCSSRVLLHGGHATFGYLASRYGLEYHALAGASPEAEPSPARMTAMIRTIKQSRVRYLFAEELLSPRMTEVLAAETGASVLRLHGAHNLSRADLEAGKTFINLMDQNLVNLQKGLGCQAK